MPLVFRQDVPLAAHTTFELGGAARFLVDVAREDELLQALSFARSRGLPTLVLGGGSNLVVADRGFDGLVIRMAIRGVDRRGERIVVAAGEPWDALVERCVDAGLAGFECLSGIPGRVGATPIQNVGAYGQDVAETIVSVRTIDGTTLAIRERATSACGFRYRHSVFKEAEGRDEIVTAVTFALRAGGPPAVRYPELEKAVRAAATTPTLASVRATVIALRRAKSMVIDPSDENRRSAGSFFTNPIVDPAVADEVARRARSIGVLDDRSQMPRFPADPGVKLSAAWLIERAGFPKGTRRGAVGVSSRHALALVHHGGGSAAELVDFACEIVETVRARFDVRLRPEPVLVGFPDDHPLLTR